MTTSGSNCVPEQRSTSASAASRGQRPAVEPARRHRVECVGDEDHARAERDRPRRRAGRIARPVPALVVMQHPVGDRLDAEALEHAVADLRMTLEHEPLGVGQRARLAQDLLRDRELAEVVQARRRAGSARSRRRPGRAAPRSAPASAATRSEWLPVYASRESTARASDAAARKRAARSTPLATRWNSDSSATSERASRTWFLPCSFAQ